MLTLVVTAQVAVAGAVVGCLGAVGIYWAPEEPYKHWIVAAGMLNGIVTSLLMTVFIRGHSPIGSALFFGALCGLVTAVVIYLAKGGWSSGDAPYVVPTGVVEGLILGMVVRWLLA